MPFITREDGERFVIPSYRDVIATKQKSQLKKEILLLSQSYGDYITLQRKAMGQYEVAFSTESGYLLGESIWHYFKRPQDMIYCESVPNSTEAILVIVKNGSVYLDGSFPTESIPEELIVFLTQQNHFEIYTYGDVPISQTPTEGKFAFDESSVKSFNVLSEPIFPTLPLLKIYQLQLVDQVLKQHGIGVFPIKQVAIVIVVIGAFWMFYNYISSTNKVVPQIIAPTNPYQDYITALSSPPPDEEMNQFINALTSIYAIPGWEMKSVEYSAGNLMVAVRSTGGKTSELMDWAEQHSAKVDIKSDGFYLVLHIVTPPRTAPRTIYPLNQIVAAVIDRLSDSYPGNHYNLAEINSKGVYSTTKLTINVSNLSPMVLTLIGQQFKDLPFVIKQISLTAKDGSFDGSIILEGLGT